MPARPEAFIFLASAATIGAMLPFQAALNAQLARFTGHPALAALISFTVGMLALLFYSFTLRWPSLPQVLQAPWWLWLGGFLGAAYVAVAAALAPRIGVATLLGATIAGQMITSLIIDHYGLLGVPKQEISLLRIVGALLLVLSVVLIRKF